MMQWPTLTSFLFATSFLPIKTFISTVEVLHPKVSKIIPKAHTGMIVTVTGVGGGQPWKPDSMSNLGITSAATGATTPSALLVRHQQEKRSAGSAANLLKYVH